jgi:hypothetical protein
MVDREYFFAVKTGYFDTMRKVCKFTPEENERLSSAAIDDMYGATDLDLIGFYENNTFTSLPIVSKYKTFDEGVLRVLQERTFIAVRDKYLVFGSSSGIVGFISNYVSEMKYCHVFKDEIFVQGFMKQESSEYIVLEYGTEAG